MRSLWLNWQGKRLILNLQKELDVVLATIKKASKIVMEYYHGDFNINLKADNSEVTDADLASNKLIVSSLKENFPDYAILSEENKDDLTRINCDFCFIVDPLDGTKDFVNRTNHFAINIALSYKHEIVLGVISIPVLGLVYYASKGNGAYKIEKGKTMKIKVRHKDDDLLLLESNFFLKGKERFENNPLIGKIEHYGSSLKACLIAEGKADLCVKYDQGSKEWDTAPSEIIIREAGGIMTDGRGIPIRYNKEDVYNHSGFIIATSLKIVDQFKL